MKRFASIKDCSRFSALCDLPETFKKFFEKFRIFFLIFLFFFKCFRLREMGFLLFPVGEQWFSRFMRIPSGIFWRCKIDEILMSFYTWFSVWFCLFGFLQKFATFCASVCEARLRLCVRLCKTCNVTMPDQQKSWIFQSWFWQSEYWLWLFISSPRVQLIRRISLNSKVLCNLFFFIEVIKIVLRFNWIFLCHRWNILKCSPHGKNSTNYEVLSLGGYVYPFVCCGLMELALLLVAVFTIPTYDESNATKSSVSAQGSEHVDDDDDDDDDDDEMFVYDSLLFLLLLCCLFTFWCICFMVCAIAIGFVITCYYNELCNGFPVSQCLRIRIFQCIAFIIECYISFLMYRPDFNEDMRNFLFTVNLKNCS